MATTTRKRRFMPAIWIASGLSAVALTLGISGTLADWTQAIIVNDTNDAQSAASVALKESSGGVDCVDTADNATNTATCSSINKFGGTAAPLAPGGSQSVTVDLTNTGSGTGALTLTAAACTNTAVTGSGADPATYPLCSQATIAVTCTTPGTLSYGPQSLTTFAGAGALTVGTLTSGQSTSCTFTVALPSTAPSGYADQIVAQQLTWDLSS